MMMHPATNRSVTALFAVAGVMLLSACSFDRPISRALTDMSFEARRQHGALFTHTEIVSLNGLMPMPEAGLIYHYTNKRFLLPPFEGTTTLPPSTAIGISRDHSFLLIGETPQTANENAETQEEEKYNQVFEIRDALLDIQQLTAKSIALKFSLQTVQREQKKAAALAKKKPKPDDKKVEQLSELATKLADQLAGTVTGLHEAQKTLRTATRSDGLLIARWKADATTSGKVKTGAFASGSASRQQQQEGFVILLGLRVSMLFFGDDFKQMVARLQDSDRGAFKFAALSTYQLATKQRVFVSDRSLIDQVRLQLEVSAAALGSPSLATLSIDKIEASAFYQNYVNLTNTGNTLSVKWEKAPYCFVAGSDLPMASPFGRSRRVNPDRSEFDNWIPVVEHLVHVKGLNKQFVKLYKRELDSCMLPPNPDYRQPCEAHRCDEFEDLRREKGWNVKKEK